MRNRDLWDWFCFLNTKYNRFLTPTWVLFTLFIFNDVDSTRMILTPFSITLSNVFSFFQLVHSLSARCTGSFVPRND